MKKFDWHYFLGSVKFHGSIFVRGLGRTFYGALIAGLFVLAGYGFASIQSEAGYIAVFDFVASCATVVVAVSNVYLLGIKKRGGKK
jgi:hypothetical protein